MSNHQTLKEDGVSEIYQSLSHSKWNCKYHIVFVPKGRRKVLFGQARRYLGTLLHALAQQKECRILEGHVMADHVSMCREIPPKHPVASVIGFLKGRKCHCDRSTVRWQRTQLYRGALLGRGCAVSTVGFELEQVRQSIREQEAADGSAGRF